MTFLFHADPDFIEGLRRHGFLNDYGFRLHNTGLDTRPFGEKWASNPLLQQAKTSNRPYYIDRITGGMPYQSLEGIESIARELKEDPQFLGFQVHEWGNSPIHDYKRIQKLLIGQGLPFDRANFVGYEGRVDYPFFSGGDYDTYRKLFTPLNSLADVNRYLEGYVRQIVGRTGGQVMAVNGYVQLYHTALRLGAKNVMAEIGNQVPLTGLQIACVRGAARQYEKPFGVYYEPWGGKPFGCPCALGWSPWFPGGQNPDNKLMGHQIRPELGSSRSLQRRLLYFAWLSGATYWAEEWGAENCFRNWEDYPLTEYGQIVKEFLDISLQWSRPKPVVPAAIVMPPGTVGIDIRYLSITRDDLYEIVKPDPFHDRMRHFAKAVLAARPRRPGLDDYNLTPSPWISCFDVLSSEAPDNLVSQYDLVVYFDRKQFDALRIDRKKTQLYTGNDQDAERCTQALGEFLPFYVEGEVGCAHARADGRYLLGVFNNLGITKTAKGEQADRTATRSAIIRGPVGQIKYILGRRHTRRSDENTIELVIPPGDLVILALPDPGRP